MGQANEKIKQPSEKQAADDTLPQLHNGIAPTKDAEDSSLLQAGAKTSADPLTGASNLEGSAKEENVSAPSQVRKNPWNFGQKKTTLCNATLVAAPKSSSKSVMKGESGKVETEEVSGKGSGNTGSEKMENVEDVSENGISVPGSDTAPCVVFDPVDDLIIAEEDLHQNSANGVSQKVLDKTETVELFLERGVIRSYADIAAEGVFELGSANPEEQITDMDLDNGNCSPHKEGGGQLNAVDQIDLDGKPTGGEGVAKKKTPTVMVSLEDVENQLKMESLTTEKGTAYQIGNGGSVNMDVVLHE